MRDEFKPLNAARRAGSDARTLSRIASFLGVPVSSFYEPEGFGSSTTIRSKSEETAVLALVRTYLEAADPEARKRFATAVQAMTGSVGR